MCCMLQSEGGLCRSYFKELENWTLSSRTKEPFTPGSRAPNGLGLGW
jgi:hypothetical protein